MRAPAILRRELAPPVIEPRSCALSEGMLKTRPEGPAGSSGVIVATASMSGPIGREELRYRRAERARGRLEIAEAEAGRADGGVGVEGPRGR